MTKPHHPILAGSVGLKDPPEWARGKWVALVGPEAVAVADTLDDLMTALGTKEYLKDPLAFRIDET